MTGHLCIPEYVYAPNVEDLDPHVAEFLQELAALEAEYGITIDHEDHHGAFILDDGNKRYKVGGL